MSKVVALQPNANDEGAVTALLSWIVLSHRYCYAGDNTGIAFLAGIAGGFGLACVLIWLVFKYGVEEDLDIWLAGCAVAGLVATDVDAATDRRVSSSKRWEGPLQVPCWATTCWLS